MTKTRGQRLVELRRKWAMRTALPARKPPTYAEQKLDTMVHIRQTEIALVLRQRKQA